MIRLVIFISIKKIEIILENHFLDFTLRMCDQKSVDGTWARGAPLRNSESKRWIRIRDSSFRTFGDLPKLGPWSELIVDRPLLRAILESSHVVKWTCRKSKHAYFSWIIQNRHLKVGSPSIWPTMTHQIFTSHYHRDRSKNNKSFNQLSNANTCKIMCIQKTDDFK